MTDTNTTDTKPQNKLSDYGILNADACDPELRNRVVNTINPCREPQTQLTADQLTEIATYINELEDALLRHHCCSIEPHQINELLKCSTGLDIEARAGELGAMMAADA